MKPEYDLSKVDPWILLEQAKDILMPFAEAAVYAENAINTKLGTADLISMRVKVAGYYLSWNDFERAKRIVNAMTQIFDLRLSATQTPEGK